MPDWIAPVALAIGAIAVIIGWLSWFFMRRAIAEQKIEVEVSYHLEQCLKTARLDLEAARESVFECTEVEAHLLDELHLRTKERNVARQQASRYRNLYHSLKGPA